ncbi:anther-specific proline-rich protein APG-like [Miscanthus floridulus]|uniref:anther-specific proline-rich protein APG-like n=1 Tax=Miscanthus floridulus TaxID=154761 RepID=UPI003459CCFE
MPARPCLRAVPPAGPAPAGPSPRPRRPAARLPGRPRYPCALPPDRAVPPAGPSPGPTPPSTRPTLPPAVPFFPAMPCPGRPWPRPHPTPGLSPWTAHPDIVRARPVPDSGEPRTPARSRRRRPLPPALPSGMPSLLLFSREEPVGVESEFSPPCRSACTALSRHCIDPPRPC